jgi:hypothetical protein
LIIYIKQKESYTNITLFYRRENQIKPGIGRWLIIDDSVRPLLHEALWEEAVARKKVETNFIFKQKK